MKPTRVLSCGAIAALSILSASLLAACGGGSADSSTTGAQQTAASVRLSTYITDNLTTDYSQVWVGIKSITAVDSDGATQTLFTSADAAGYSTYDLRSLASVGELMSAATIPAGVYRQILVALAPDVKLVKASDSSVIQAKFTSDDSDKVVKVGVTLDTSSSTALVLDFNLEKFTYSASTNLVTPDVSRKDGDALKKFKVHQGSVRGAVVSVDSTANTITVNDARLGSNTVLSLSSDAVITKESDGSVVALADLAVGTVVEARGTVTSASTDAAVTVAVTAVKIESSSSSAATANRYRGEGTVSAINGTTLTLALTDANFLPTSATLTLDVASARYAHGQLSDLAVGSALRFQASYNASTDSYTAALVDVAGAASAKERERENHGNSGASTRPTKIEGAITSISGTSWTIGDTTVDVSNAYIKGSASCQIVGSTVEALGTLSGTTLTARMVKVETCATGSTS